MLGEIIYNQILYNHRLKRLAVVALKSPLLLKNPLYSSLYNRLLTRKMARFEKVPFRVMIENTNACGANCVFCPHQKMQRKIGIIEMALYKKIIDECRQLGIDYVTIYGFGEPLLDKKFFERVRYAKSAGIPRVTTNTNGMYLNQEKIEEVFASGLDEIYISFDAATAATYQKIRPGLDFKTVANNILALLDKKEKRGSPKPEIVLSYVESPVNRRETQRYLQQWKNLVDHISISSIHNWTGAVNLGGASNAGRRDPCRLLWTDMVISWNGDVPLCCNDYENRVVLGNLKRQSISEIWGGTKLQAIRTQHQRGEFDKISICKDCEYNYHHKSPWWVAK